MTNDTETRHFTCKDRAGRIRAVAEQIWVARDRDDKTDYVTEDGDLVSWIDDNHFLVLLSRQGLQVTSN